MDPHTVGSPPRDEYFRHPGVREYVATVVQKELRQGSGKSPGSTHGSRPAVIEPTLENTDRQQSGTGPLGGLEIRETHPEEEPSGDGVFKLLVDEIVRVAPAQLFVLQIARCIGELSGVPSAMGIAQLVVPFGD